VKVARGSVAWVGSRELSPATVNSHYSQVQCFAYFSPHHQGNKKGKTASHFPSRKFSSKHIFSDPGIFSEMIATRSLVRDSISL
jgi:hypothetical protein